MNTKYLIALKEKVENIGVVGHEHEVFSEGIVAFVEKKKGKNLTVNEVNKAAKGLAAYKRPSLVIILEYNDLPLNRLEQKIKELRKNGGWDKK